MDDESKPADTVLKQNPPANSKLGQGEQVTLTVAKAPADEPATVPDVTDQLVKDARKALEDAGFKVQVQGAPDENNATVVTTSPAANTQGKKGDTVIIIARQGQPGGDGGGGDGGGFPFGGPSSGLGRSEKN